MPTYRPNLIELQLFHLLKAVSSFLYGMQHYPKFTRYSVIMSQDLPERLNVDCKQSLISSGMVERAKYASA